MIQEQDYQWARPYLDIDERILWRGCPEKLHLLDRTDVCMIPFSLLWCGFMVNWEYSVIRMHAPIMFIIFGGAGVMLGLFLLFGRFFYKSHYIRSCSYVITDKNVLIKQRKEVKVLNKQALPALSVRKYQDGTGTIALEQTSLFGRKQGIGMRYGMDMRSMCGIRDELHGIQEPEQVLRLLQEGFNQT